MHKEDAGGLKMACIYCGHSKDWVGSHRYCVNSNCSMFLSGLNFNSPTIDLKRFLLDEPHQVKNRDPEVLKHVKDILDGRKNGRYVNTNCGWIEAKEA